MSDEDKDSKTEEPTPQKLSKAFKEGDLPIGKDASTVASLTFGFFALAAIGQMVGTSLVEAVTTSIRQMAASTFVLNGEIIAKPMLSMVIIGGSAALGASAITLSQTKATIWPQKMAPDITKCFNIDKVTQIFKVDFLVDLGMTLLKVAGIMTLAVWVLYDDFMALSESFYWPQKSLLAAMVYPLAKMIVFVIFAMVAIAVLDYVIQANRFKKKMMMSMDEIKRELKEEMGDPHIRGKRKAKAREIAQNRIAVEVPKADALVVNPTHIAIAIRYVRGKDEAPKVTAKGKDKVADLMRQLARENSVPIVKDVPLARLLYKKVKVGKTVPAETYKAVAAILAFVYRVTGRLPGMRRHYE